MNKLRRGTFLQSGRRLKQPQCAHLLVRCFSMNTLRRIWYRLLRQRRFLGLRFIIHGVTSAGGTARVSEDMDGTYVWKTQDAGTHRLSVGSERRFWKKWNTFRGEFPLSRFPVLRVVSSVVPVFSAMLDVFAEQHVIVLLSSWKALPGLQEQGLPLVGTAR